MPPLRDAQGRFISGGGDKDLDAAMKALEADGVLRTVRAFKQGLVSVEALAKAMCPVGHYGRSRGKAGRPGGDLRQSLRVVFLGQQGNELVARLTSDSAYARPQHDNEYHHPGLYTGAPGDKYAAKFFERAVEIVFGDGEDPLARFHGPLPAHFKELLEEQEG